MRKVSRAPAKESEVAPSGLVVIGSHLFVFGSMAKKIELGWDRRADPVKNSNLIYACG